MSAMALPMLAFYAVGALTPFLVADALVTPSALGYLTLSAFGFAAFLSLWSGALVNYLGSRCSLELLFVASALAYGLMAMVPGFWGLVLGLAVCGIAQALANPATNLLILECVPAREKAAVIGFKQAGVQMSALIAGLLLPGVAQWLGWRIALLFIVPLALLLALSVPRGGARSLGNCPPMRFALKRPTLLLSLLMAVQLCTGVALSSFVTFLGLFSITHGMSPQHAGGLLAVFGVTGLLTRVFLTPLSAHMRDESLLLLVLLIFAAFSVWITSSANEHRHWPLWLGSIGMGSTAMATNAIAMSMLLRDPGFGPPAVTAGMLSAGFFSGFALGPPMFGALIHKSMGFYVAWNALVVVLLAGGLICWALHLARRIEDAS